MPNTVYTSQDSLGADAQELHKRHPKAEMKYRRDLIFENSIHQQEYNEARMNEASLTLEVFVIVLLSVNMAARLLTDENDNTLSSLFTLLRGISIALLAAYTIYLMGVKQIISNLIFLDRINPVFLCDAGLILGILGLCGDLLFISVQDSRLPFTVIVIVYQTFFFRVYFGIAHYYSYLFVCLASTSCICISIISQGLPLPLVAFCILSGFLTAVVAYDSDLIKIRKFVNNRDLEFVIRTAIEQENKKLEAERLSEELRSFIGNVAHDLKTPLQAFVSGLDSLSQDSTRRERDASIATLGSTCAFMQMMINRSLDFVKSEAGVVLKPNISCVDLKMSLDWVTTCIRRVSDKVPLKIIEKSSSICRFVITDKQWLEENLLCLTSNAVKFTTTGCIEIVVSLTTEEFMRKVEGCRGISLAEDVQQVSHAMSPNVARQSSSGIDFQLEDIESQVDYKKVAPEECMEVSDAVEVILFEVQDTGIGLSAEQRKDLYRPFKQAQRKAGGTGLGLYALAKRVEAANGMYGVRERHDGCNGSLFWFTIPYRPDHMIAASMMNRSSDNLNAGNVEFCDLHASSRILPMKEPQMMIKSLSVNSSSALRILLVDDAIIIQKATRKALQNEGYFVVSAMNGVECLDALQTSSPFDVVLLDMQMPVMDGLETISRLRELEALQDAPKRQFVVGVSAYSDIETKEQALAAGMDDFIIKPLSIATLKDCCYKHHIIMR